MREDKYSIFTNMDMFLVVEKATVASVEDLV